MPTQAISAGFNPTTDAVNATNFITRAAIAAALNGQLNSSAGSKQTGALIAKLAGSVTASGRTAQRYAIMQPSLAGQDDAVQVLGFLTAYVAASSCANKYQIGDVIEQVARLAYLLSDEIFGLRRCPLNRPDSDQMNTLLAQIGTARSTAGLDPLPGLPS